MGFSLITITSEVECPICLSGSVLIHINKIAVVYECQDPGCNLEVALSHKKNMERVDS